MAGHIALHLLWQSISTCRGGELYQDTDKNLYKALGNGKLRRGSLTWFLNPWSVIWKHAKWAREECGIKESNLKVSSPSELACLPVQHYVGQSSLL